MKMNLNEQVNKHYVWAVRLVVICVFLPISVARCADVGFELDVDLPPRTNSAIRFTLTLTDVSATFAETARAYEAGAGTLSRKEMLQVVYWYLSKSQFVKADKLLQKIVETHGVNDKSIFLIVAVTQICRGDYETACQNLKKLEDDKENKMAVYWRIYIKSVILHSGDDVLKEAETVVIQREINQVSFAMSSVLGTCLESKGGKSLFQTIVRNVDREVLLQTPENTRAYVALCLKYAMNEELEKIKLLQKRLNK